ncbi:MAG: hypothetical protein ACI4SF_12750 [Oscillospiraceae bacterium]
MNNEQKSEIIKSFALGMTAAEIAAVEGISTEEAEQISYDEADAISRKKAFMESVGRA